MTKKHNSNLYHLINRVLRSKLLIRYASYALVVLVLFCMFSKLWQPNRSSVRLVSELLQDPLNNSKLPVRRVKTSGASFFKSVFQRNCSMKTCFDIRRCGYSVFNEFSIGVYPAETYVDENAYHVFELAPPEFIDIVRAIETNEFHRNSIVESCVIMPSFSFLNGDRLRHEAASLALRNLSLWRREADKTGDGSNHLIFNFVHANGNLNSDSSLDMGSSMLASADFARNDFRPRFDISIPMLNPMVSKQQRKLLVASNRKSRRRFVLFIHKGFYPHVEKIPAIQKLVQRQFESVIYADWCSNSSLNNLKVCASGDEADMENLRIFAYAELLLSCEFCLISKSSFSNMFLYDALSSGCIPQLLTLAM